MNYSIESFEQKVLHRSHAADRSPLGFVAKLRHDSGREFTVSRLPFEVNWIVAPVATSPGERIAPSRALKANLPIVDELNQLVKEVRSSPNDSN